jgi:hypothetical protein
LAGAHGSMAVLASCLNQVLGIAADLPT